MPRELFEKLKEYLEKKRIEIALYNADVEAAKLLETRTAVKEYLRLCGKTSVVPPLKTFSNLEGFNEFVERNDITDTNGLYVYCGTYTNVLGYGYDREVKKFGIRTKRKDENAIYRRYWDIEKNAPFECPIEECEEFEANNKVLNLSIDAARGKFVDLALKKGQEEAVKELTKVYSIKK